VGKKVLWFKTRKINIEDYAAPFAVFIITFANTGIFGWVKGAILSWLSAMTGAAF
jgi:uncharacterized membrane protein YdjX (TVP38/TMEM64 family)